MDPSNQTSLIDGEAGEYLVLARKYRPRDFSTLIGQDALVRTLRNAFETGRLAHAFLLSGVRGVGKTTTARIVARALNCQEDGRTSPAADPLRRTVRNAAITESTPTRTISNDRKSCFDMRGRTAESGSEDGGGTRRGRCVLQ